MTLEDLNRLRFLREEIRRLDEKAEVLRARAERLTPILTDMPSGSHDHDQMAGIIAELVDNERRAAEKALALTQACEDTERWLDALPDQQRRVMRLYYVDGIRTWKEVAELLPYSERHCRRIKNAALARMSSDVRFPCGKMVP